MSTLLRLFLRKLSYRHVALQHEPDIPLPPSSGRSLRPATACSTTNHGCLSETKRPDRAGL